MSWTYELTATATKDLRDIGPSAAKSITDYLDKRVLGCDDPRAFGKPLRGDKYGRWRYRVQDYRIICEIQDDRIVVLVVHAGHRREVYD